MHEMSIAVEICRMAAEHMAVAAGAPATGSRGAGVAARPPRLLGLGLEVGDDSGVEAESLQFCLEALLAEPPFGGTRVSLARASGDVLRLTYLEVDDGGADD